MRAFSSLLLADFASELAELEPARADYLIAIGALFLVALVPNFVAAKVLAEERGTLPRVLGVLLFQVVAGAVIIGVTVSIALAPNVRLPLVIGIALALLTIVTAKIYGFGMVKGLLYTLGTALVMWGIFQAIIVALDPMPLRKVLYSLSARAESARQAKNAGEGNAAPEQASTAAVEENTERTFATEAEARDAAMKKYPALAVQGSDFNRRFVELHAQFKVTMPGVLAKPNWPMVLADEVAKEKKRK
jgi:hypothetical protein